MLERSIVVFRWIAVLPASTLAALIVFEVGKVASHAQSPLQLGISIVAGGVVVPSVLVSVARLIAPDAKKAVGLVMAIALGLGIASLATARSATPSIDLLLIVPVLVAIVVAFLRTGPAGVRAQKLPAVAGWLLFLPLAICGALLCNAFIELIGSAVSEVSSFAIDLEVRFLVLLVFAAIVGAIIPAGKRAAVSTIGFFVVLFGVYLVLSGLAGMHVISQLPNSSTLDPEAKNIDPRTSVIQGLASMFSAMIPIVVAYGNLLPAGVRPGRDLGIEHV